MQDIKKLIEELKNIEFEKMYNNDFFLTWEKTDDELKAVFTVADILRKMRENNISTKIFDSGLGISVFVIIQQEQDLVLQAHVTY